MYDYKQSLEPIDPDSKVRIFSSLHPKVDQFRNGAKLDGFINEILNGNFITTNEEDE